MPHLQLDTAWSYPVEVKRELARRFGEAYAETMQTSPDMVDVTIRELDGVVHTGFSPDWTPEEANTPLIEQLREANR